MCKSCRARAPFSFSKGFSATKASAIFFSAVNAHANRIGADNPDNPFLGKLAKRSAAALKFLRLNSSVVKNKFVMEPLGRSLYNPFARGRASLMRPSMTNNTKVLRLRSGTFGD